MPNWVKNDVRIKNTQAIKDCIKTDAYKTVVGDEEYTYFDFNEIIPMPEELKEKDKTYPSWEKENKQDLNLIKKYGADNWYDWSVRNWGTKWNTGSVRKTGVNAVEFDTAWSTPEPALCELSKKYNTRVEVYYADENLGHNCGYYAYENGNLVEETVGDYEMACEIWGYDPEEEKEAMEGVA